MKLRRYNTTGHPDPSVPKVVGLELEGRGWRVRVALYVLYPAEWPWWRRISRVGLWDDHSVYVDQVRIWRLGVGLCRKVA